MTPFLSICIPSYNRPQELYRLLESIDSKQKSEIEIVITEDCAPKRVEVREIVKEYRNKNPYLVRYYENETNLGYDNNIRHVADLAQGVWVMFMGDDDIFVPNALDLYIDFLQEHSELGYVLRRYRTIYKDGTLEDFRYNKGNVFFKAGEESYVELFRRSVFISGFCFRKECFNDYDCADYDGTLLYQLYIEAQICLKYPSAYCDIPITQSMEGGIPYFGNSQKEKNKYISGSNPVSNSLTFMKQVKVMAESIDKKNKISCIKKIMNSYSKYSYGFLLEQRDAGIKTFRNYAKELRNMGFGESKYFTIYYWMLLVCGREGAGKIIRICKKILGRTPKL